MSLHSALIKKHKLGGRQWPWWRGCWEDEVLGQARPLCKAAHDSEIHGDLPSQGDAGKSSLPEALRPPSGEVYPQFDSLLF